MGDVSTFSASIAFILFVCYLMVIPTDGLADYGFGFAVSGNLPVLIDILWGRSGFMFP